MSSKGPAARAGGAPGGAARGRRGRAEEHFPPMEGDSNMTACTGKKRGVRVNRALAYGAGGYRLLLDRMKRKEE